MSELEDIYSELSARTKKLTLPPDAAGRKTTTKVPLATKRQTVGKVRQLLFEKTDNYDTINYIYVVSKKGILKGVFSIKEIFKNPPETLVKDIYNQEVIKAHLKDDQEKVAHLALKNNLKAIPLVNGGGHFFGVVPADQIHNILDHETKEDLLRLTGIIGTQEDTSSLPVLVAFKGRVPWIIIGLLGGLVTATTISSFQDILSKNLVLASFIPLIAYISNAVANQSQTLFIRDLATQKDVDFKKYLAKQLATTSLIALVCWVLIFTITAIFWNSGFLGIVVGLAMTCAIYTATFLGLIIPRVLKFFNQDPAVGSGPFATVIQDFLSVVIYFTISSRLL